MCEDVITGPQFNNVFQRIEDMYQASLEALGGEYIKQPHEKHRTCAIRLASSLFFEDHPPDHHRFEDERIPSHVTYAYKQGATIARNDDFYTMSDGGTKKLDILFL